MPGFFAFFSEAGDCFTKENLEKYFNEFSGYKYIINSHVPCHYHGVAMLIKQGISFQELEFGIC